MLLINNNNSANTGKIYILIFFIIKSLNKTYTESRLALFENSFVACFTGYPPSMTESGEEGSGEIPSVPNSGESHTLK